MEYRRFGKLAWDISLLGFGCMRLPTTDGMPISENVDEDEAVRMIRRALDRGVNYADTAYSYHGGRSEVGACLWRRHQNSPRSSSHRLRPAATRGASSSNSMGRVKRGPGIMGRKRSRSPGL